MTRDHTTGRNNDPPGQKTSGSRAAATEAAAIEPRRTDSSTTSTDEPLVDIEHDIPLDQLRSQTSTTPVENQERCPDCGSVNISGKRSGPAMRKHPEDYRCECCGSHFDDPDPPKGGDA